MQANREKEWAALVLAAGLFLSGGCRQASEEDAVENGSGNTVLPLPPLPVAEPPIGREALLLAAARSASAAALGRDDSAQQRELDGKRFEVRIRFGCPPGRSGTDAGSRFEVRFDEEGRTLRLRAAPDLSLNDKAVAGLAGESVEAVEGFWIQRPWLLADGCPPVPQPRQNATGSQASIQEETAEGGADSPAQGPDRSDPPPISRQRIGIAQFFTAADSRTGRRDDRAYEATKVLEENEQPSAEGYNLVLSGRLRAQPLGRVIACPVASNDAPPQCIVSVEFDRVRIEQPGSKRIVAEWSS